MFVAMAKRTVDDVTFFSPRTVTAGSTERSFRNALASSQREPRAPYTRRSKHDFSFARARQRPPGCRCDLLRRWHRRLSFLARLASRIEKRRAVRPESRNPVSYDLRQPKISSEDGRCGAQFDRVPARCSPMSLPKLVTCTATIVRGPPSASGDAELRVVRRPKATKGHRMHSPRPS